MTATGSNTGEIGKTGGSRGSRMNLAAAMLMLAIVFTALGTWQVQRLLWKQALIERVEARMTALPIPAAGPAAMVTADADEYRRVTATGVFRHDKETLVQAVTALGAGFWVMTPLMQDDGTAVLINRGFVPIDRRDPASRSQGNGSGTVGVTGLLRITQPGGAFLRQNDPDQDRWYSRDVTAIAAAKGLATVAPYFIDADATPNPGGLPVGGLTVTRFPNSHLAYALTWCALAVMSAGAAYAVQRRLIG